MSILVAQCQNVREPEGTPCPGRISYRWGQSDAACGLCGARCGIAVAHWLAVLPATSAEAERGGRVNDTDAVARLAEALYGDEAPEYLDAPRLAALLPVVREIADQRAAEELEAAAGDLPYAPAAKSQWLRARAAALRGATDV